MKPEFIPFLKRAIPGFEPDDWQTELAGAAGSYREFHRLTDGPRSFILMAWHPTDPDWPRCLGIHDAIAPHCNLIPRIHAVDHARGLILEDDLGSRTLHAAALATTALVALYEPVIDALVRWQAADVDHPFFQARVMDREDLAWETAYFAEHCVAGHCGLNDLLDTAWEAERLDLAAAADALPKVWMHRDFQSENIMLEGDNVRFVDYQGARLGPLGYDLASLLFDPYVPALGQEERDALLARFRRHRELPAHAFHICAAQRLMQALGAYGNLSRNHGKPRYLRFVPLALDRLAGVLRHLPELPVTARIVEACCRRAATSA